MVINRSQVTAGFQRCHNQDTAPWGAKQGGRPHPYPAGPYPRASPERNCIIQGCQKDQKEQLGAKKTERDR